MTDRAPLPARDNQRTIPRYRSIFHEDAPVLRQLVFQLTPRHLQRGPSRV